MERQMSDSLDLILITVHNRLSVHKSVCASVMLLILGFLTLVSPYCVCCVHPVHQRLSFYKHTLHSSNMLQHSSNS